MELIVTFVMAHGTTVITMLLGAIILCVFGLLIIGFHSPKDLVMGELGSIDRVEGVLRRILSEQHWPQTKVGAKTDDAVSALSGSGDQSTMFLDQIERLEKEIMEKQQVIEKLESSGAVGADNAAAVAELEDLKKKVKDLEEKLGEYAVIEEDIADLSKFRQENEDLRNKISHVTGVPANEAVIMPWDEFEKAVKEKKVKPAMENVDTTIPTKE